jgi:hypothetical protein
MRPSSRASTLGFRLFSRKTARSIESGHKDG